MVLGIFGGQDDPRLLDDTVLILASVAISSGVRPAKKVVGISTSRFRRRVTVGLGFLFLCAVPGLARSQGSPPPSARKARTHAPAARPKRGTPLADDFTGLTLTGDQKAKVDQIHKDMKLRMDAMVKDENLDAVQKDAMLVGLLRIESRQIDTVLTPEQRLEVRNRILARRAAEREERKKNQPLRR